MVAPITNSPASASTTGTSQAGQTGATASPAAVGGGVTAGGASVALYQALDITHIASGPLGLPVPLNQQDSATLLAEAELLLDQTAGKARDFKISNALGNARNAAFGSEQSLAGLSGQLVANSAKLAGLQVQEGHLQDQEHDLQQHSAQDGTQIASLSATITSLDGQIAAAKAATHPDQGQIDALTAQRDAATDDRSTVQADKTSTDSQLTDVQTQLASVQGQITATQNNIAKNSADIAATVHSLQITFASLATTVQTGGGTKEQNQTRSKELQRGFDTVTDLTDQFDQDSLKRAELNAKRDSTRTDQEDHQAVQKLALGLATGVADILGALSQLTVSPSGDRSQETGRSRVAL